MPTPEELAQLEADKAAEAAAQKAAEEEAKKAKEKELESIPEAFRGKSQKELSDLLLQQALETEKLRSDAERAKTLESELQRFKPQQLTEEEKKQLEEKEFYTKGPDFLKRHVDERLKPIYETYFRDKETDAKEWATKELEDFPKYDKKIAEIMKNLSPEVRSSKDAWKAVHRQIRYDDIVAENKELKAKSGLHSEAHTSTESDQTSKKKPLSSPRTGEVYSDEEVNRVASKFGMSKDDMLAWSDKFTGD